MKKLILSCVFCLAIFPSFILADAPQALWVMQGVDMRPVLVTPAKLKLMAVGLQEQNSEKAYSIDVHYPQVMGAPNNSAAQHFNQLIQTTINQHVDAFKASLNNAKPNPALPKNAKNYLKINYEMAGFASQSQKTEYISIRFRFNSYLRGMAHPAQEIWSVNYDLGHDKSLALADLFNPNLNYLSVISDYCVKQLEAKKLPEMMIRQGAAPQASNFKNWNLTLGGLLITFDEAQVAPRYFGTTEVVIPKEVLEPIVTHPTACTLSFINCDGT